MSERERLIAIIKQSVVPYFAEEIADNLLKNGVIVPPVKKGDTKNEIPRSIRNYKR